MTATPPGFVYRQIPINYTVQTSMAARSLGLILHVATGGNFSLYGWFSQSRARESSHWWAGYNPGQREQYLDPDRMRSWAQAGGNSTYHSIETAGDPDAPLTPGQVESCAQLYAWGHQRYGWPFRLAEHPGEPGFGWHGMGGAAWGGHTGCPGDLRKAQRPAILARAQQIAGSGGTLTGGAGGMGGGGPAPTQPPAPLPPKDDDEMITQEAQDWLTRLVSGKLDSLKGQVFDKIDTGTSVAVRKLLNTEPLVPISDGTKWPVVHTLDWLRRAVGGTLVDLVSLRAEVRALTVAAQQLQAGQKVDLDALGQQVRTEAEQGVTDALSSLKITVERNPS